ncbi:transposase [Flavobacterium sp. FlaQc-48]|uniref:transposase n=1 Tax=Flavobacterium sp. FlaQc-48 TaxID=3374181 RepID=UPI0037578ED4
MNRSSCKKRSEGDLYNYEFKLRCVQEVLKNNYSIRSVARENNFTESNFRKWVNLYTPGRPRSNKT